ncbi:MAG: endonuclease/exonuclease/phosphatase family protein [Cyclobacteriaceae bacterium]
MILASGCADESIDPNPRLQIMSSMDALNVTLKGSAEAPKGEINKMLIEWGDDQVDQLTNIDFSNIEITHLYDLPGSYSITSTAINNAGDSSSMTITVDINYRETSLENIKSGLIKMSDKEYLILTINLHTYQESQQNEKLNMIVDVIGQLEVDFIALQECGQNKSSPILSGIIREDNMAMILANRVKEKYNADYNFVWNWAHLGWDVWEEGVAILSKHPLVDTDERYISSNTSTQSITSRKVIYGSYQLETDKINIFSAHTHWRTTETDEEHNNQIGNIKSMVEEKKALAVDATSFVCGDFNVNPTSDYPWSEGYHTMMENNDYQDTFLEIYPDANNRPAKSIYNTVGGSFPGRIDYIFMNENSRYQVSESQIIFTSSVVGKVSDHFGVLTKIVDSN